MKIGINDKKMPIPALFRSLIASFKKDGATVFTIDDPNKYPECDFVLGSGIPKRSLMRMSRKRKNEYYFMDSLFKAQAERGGSVLVAESGYVKRTSHFDDSKKYYKNGKRVHGPNINKAYYSLGFNGLNGRAKFVHENMPSDRWDKLNVRLKPWQSGGEHILFCGQKGNDSSVQHLRVHLPKIDGVRPKPCRRCTEPWAYMKWTRRILPQLGSLSDRTVVFRPHPHEGLRSFKRLISGGGYQAGDEGLPLGVKLSDNLDKPIEADLENCHLLCSLNSNSTVEATIAGIPVMAFDRGCMVWEGCNQYLSSERLVSPKNFDRNNWKNNIGYSQWALEEIVSGEAFHHLKLVLSSGIKLNYKDGIPSNMNL